MTRKLTEKQQKFLQVLFDEAGGDPLEAKKLAGYSSTVNTSEITNALADEIADLTKKFIASAAPKAAYGFYEVIKDPVALGNKEKMLAAKEILDRAGFSKTEKVEVQAVSPLFILPAKNETQEDD